MENSILFLRPPLAPPNDIITRRWSFYYNFWDLGRETKIFLAPSKGGGGGPGDVPIVAPPSSSLLSSFLSLL